MLARNTILQSRYRIVRPLGKGGMGQVYEAIDDTVDSIVAIKETFANTDKLRSAFEHEAKLLASLRHPVLPRVMHHFLQGDGQFLVMDFVDGLSLAQLLDLRGLPFRYETVVPWTDKLLDALSYLHRQREPIIHRDIKPANIKVTNEGEVYLLDFGLAKGAPGQESSVHGYTAAYAPLEQLNNSSTNQQSDLYSLGATLYHLLTGHLPISASKRNEIIEEKSRDPLIPVHKSNPEIPESISAIISQAMEMKRRDRFASAASMREVLREATLLIEREREQKILETPTRLTDKASRSKEHKLVLRETDAAADLGDQQFVNPVVPWNDLGREDVYQKTMDHVTPPVVPPPPPSDPAQRSWPSHIDSEQGKSPDLEKEREEEERKRRQAAEEEARRAEGEAKKRVEEDRLLKKAEARRLAEEEERKRLEQETARQAKQAEKRAEERRLREEAERQRAAAEEHRLKEKIGTIPAPYIPQPPPIDPEVTQLAPLPAPPRPFWNKRRILIGAAATSVILTVVALILFPSRSGDNKTISNGSKPTPTKDASGQPAAPEGMVYVPGSVFMMGQNKSDGGDDYESPAHQVTVAPFFIDIYEVTNEDYAKFVKATNRHAPATWNNGSYPANDIHKPVTGIEWADADAYAKWAGKRLPTEEEWEFTARGTDGRRYPWGNDWQQGLANANGASNGLVDVGTYKGPSPFNVVDMIGNAWEWTASKLVAYPGGRLPKKFTGLRVIRGGAFDSNQNQASSTYRVGWAEHGASDYGKTGFRCVKEATPSPSEAIAPQPTMADVRVQLLSQGAMHYSPYSGLVVVLRVDGLTFKETTNNNGWATFKQIPCEKSITIDSPDFKLQNGKTWQVNRNLPCSASPVMIGSFGDVEGTQISKADRKFILTQ